MFFIYLLIFIIIVATPFIVQEGFWIFNEDETEALILLVAGVASFVIYRLRDYQVFENIKDRMRLQRLFARAQKDLSESYSYIGQMNRRTDIMYDIFSNLSHMDAQSCDDAIMSAMHSLPYTNYFCFRFIDLKKKKTRHRIGTSDRFLHLPDALFCKEANSRSYRHEDILFVYAEAEDKNLRACVALPFSNNAEDDIDFFKALCAYFLIVYIYHNNPCIKNDNLV